MGSNQKTEIDDKMERKSHKHTQVGPPVPFKTSSLFTYLFSSVQSSSTEKIKPSMDNDVPVIPFIEK